MALEYTTLQVSIKDNIAEVKLNRADKRNALNPAMVEELTTVFNQLAINDQVRVVVLTGEGKAFSAGADLAYLQELQGYSREENQIDSQELGAMFKALWYFPKPLIAKVNGHALAGGCGLLTTCDFVFCHKEAKLGYTEVKIGFVPAIVMGFLVRKIGEGQARRLLLSGELIDATDAYRLGLVHYVCDEDLDEKVASFASTLVVENSPNSMQKTKAMLNSLPGLSMHETLVKGMALNADVRLSKDCKKGVNAFLNKTRPDWSK